MTARTTPEPPPRAGVGRRSYRMNVLAMSGRDAGAVESMLIERGWSAVSRRGNVVSCHGNLDALFDLCSDERIRLESVEVFQPERTR